MKDPDSSSDVKNTDSSEDMSLADLLGGGEDEAEDKPKRVDHREDEPDSGMVNLAKMVADSSVEVAKTPSIIPPPADPTGSQPVGDPSGAVQTQAGAPVAAAPAQKKGSGPIIALIVVVLLAAAAVIGYIATRGEPKEDDAAAIAAAKAAEELKAELEAERQANKKAMDELMARMAALTEKKTEGEDEAPSAEEAAKLEELQKQMEEAKAKEEELAMKAEEAEKAAEAKKSETPKKTSTAKKSSSGSSSTPKKTSTAKKSSSEPKKKAASGGSDKTSELDSLLGGSKKEEPKAAAKKADDGLPKTPSKGDVKKAMGPVQARAQKICAKYSTGTVQVQMVVGSNGRVKKATPKGAFAGNQAGKCVAMMARSAKFPKFKDPTYSFLYPIILK